jgi:hypothetical protein
VQDVSSRWCQTTETGGRELAKGTPARSTIRPDMQPDGARDACTCGRRCRRQERRRLRTASARGAPKRLGRVAFKRQPGAARCDAQWATWRARVPGSGDASDPHEDFRGRNGNDTLDGRLGRDFFAVLNRPVRSRRRKLALPTAAGQASLLARSAQVRCSLCCAARGAGFERSRFRCCCSPCVETGASNDSGMLCFSVLCGRPRQPPTYCAARRALWPCDPLASVRACVRACR